MNIWGQILKSNTYDTKFWLEKVDNLCMAELFTKLKACKIFDP